MNKPLVIGLSLVTIGAIVGLVIMSRADSKPAQAPEQPAAKADHTATPVDTKPATSTPVPRPTISDDTSDEPSREIDTPRAKSVYYRDDGTEVRDYRSGDRPPVTSRPRSKSRRTARIELTVVSKVRKQIQPEVHKCSKTIDKELLADDAAVQAQIKVKVQAGNVSVDRTELQIRGVDDAAVEELRQCLTEPLQAITVAAEGHKDVDEHMLTFPFRLRR